MTDEVKPTLGASSDVDKAQAEDANWRMAHEWHTGMSFVLNGVDLADAMTYDVLRVCGGVWKAFMDNLEKVNDGT